MATESWVDVLPAIPLARGVPVLVVDGGTPIYPATVTRIDKDYGTPSVVYLDNQGDEVGMMPAGEHRVTVGDTRVDLDDPRGFGYVLTWGYQKHGLDFTQALAKALGEGFVGTVQAFTMLLNAWASGQVEDYHCAALARAIAEVQS